MALRKTQSSNNVGLRFAFEDSLGVLPVSPTWRPLEPNSFSDFGGSIKTVARRPLNPSRQRKKGVTTDLDASGGFNTDFTESNLQLLLQTFFFALLRTKDELDVATVNGTHYDADTAVVVAGGTHLYEVGDLLDLVGGTFGTVATAFVATITADQEAASASVVGGGTSGYSVGDLLNIVGGSSVHTVAKAYVASVDGGGVVLTVNFSGAGAVPGDYGTVPSNPVSTTVATGSGVGVVTLTVTWSPLTEGKVTTVNFSGAGAVPGDYTVKPGNPVSTTVNTGSGTGLVTLTVTWETLSDADYVVAAGGDAYVAGDLLFAKGFDDPGNNGLKELDAGSGATNVNVTNLLIEAATQTGVISRVGFECATGDINVDATGDLPALTSTIKDFTDFGLIPGEWVFVGGDVTGEKFVTGANNGFARVRSIDTNRMEFDKTSAVWQTETGTGLTVRLFFSRLLRNELGENIVRQPVQLERSLGAPDDSLPNDLQAEYGVGGVANEFVLNIKQADKITADLNFVFIDFEQVTADDGLKSGDRPAVEENDAFNTSTDFKRIKLSLVDPANTAPTPLFAFVTDLKLTLKNNAKPDKAVGILGAFEVTSGLFEVGGSMKAYFADVESTKAVRDNSDVTLDVQIVKQNKGVTIDLPLVSLGNGRPDIQQDAPITLPLTMDAATASKIDPDLDYTAQMQFWDYLPDAAHS